MLEQELVQLVADRRFYEAFDLGGHELVFRLRGELRIGQLHRQDGREAFTSIIARRRNLLFLSRRLLLDVIVEGSGQGAAETARWVPPSFCGILLV